MTERGDLLVSIAKTISDYREGALARPTPNHVNTWVSQFTPGTQEGILRELDHVLKQAYYSKSKVTQFLNAVLKSDKLAGSDPSNFWKNVGFFNNQENGHSQKEMLKLVDDILKNSFRFSTNDCKPTSNTFI